MASMQDQLHGEMDVLQQSAKTAGSVADSINGHRASLQPVVGAMHGQWVGTSYEAFVRAHEQWDQGITRLTAALGNLGENTQFSANTYLSAEDAARAGIESAQGHSPFGGALRA